MRLTFFSLCNVVKFFSLSLCSVIIFFNSLSSVWLTALSVFVCSLINCFVCLSVSLSCVIDSSLSLCVQWVQSEPEADGQGTLCVHWPWGHTLSLRGGGLRILWRQSRSSWGKHWPTSSLKIHFDCALHVLLTWISLCVDIC